MSNDTPDQPEPPIWTPPPLKTVAEQHRERRQLRTRAAVTGITFVVGYVAIRVLREWWQGRLNFQW